MSDLVVRLRQTGQTYIAASRTTGMVATDILFQMFAALTPVIHSTRLARDLKIEEVREPFYLFALLCALEGIDVVEMLNADIVKREFGKMTLGAGEAAPIPDSNGVLRDPVTRRPSSF